uniref:MIP09063p n=1 Tax=Drosophila melanogaster TaxID=7227 RepID=C0PV68_DROME|nr:MIP09063p [Drosophila melanogaster]
MSISLSTRRVQLRKRSLLRSLKDRSMGTMLSRKWRFDSLDILAMADGGGARKMGSSMKSRLVCHNH